MLLSFLLFFFFNDTATTEIYTLSLHDALPICRVIHLDHAAPLRAAVMEREAEVTHRGFERSEEHTSELQSRRDLVCRLLLEKKKKKKQKPIHETYNNSYSIMTAIST